MSIFKIGDRVYHEIYGPGTIITIKDFGPSIGVSHDTPNENLHSLGYRLNDPTGWWHAEYDLVLLPTGKITECKFKVGDHVVIKRYNNGATVVSSRYCPEHMNMLYSVDSDKEAARFREFAEHELISWDEWHDNIRIKTQEDEDAQIPAVDPKQAAGNSKMGFDAIPITLMIQASKTAQNGADKYGMWNWLELDNETMSLSTYLNAIQRHLLLYKAGQDNASDSGLHHLEHILIGVGVVRDAMLFGKVKDDRIKLSKEQLEVLENLIEDN